MKKTVTTLILFLFVLVCLSGCKIVDESSFSSGDTSSSSEVDVLCPTGTTVYDVPVDHNNLDRPTYVDAYTVRPNEGCNLPTLYCVYANTYSDNGGPTCNVIDK